MNNKTYVNYLMHGRTKGSRNGISTTKGYTAVGQKAKGKLINGKYVYDDPSFALGTTQMNNAANWQQAANATRAEQEQYNRWYGKGTQKTSGIAKPGLDPDLSNGRRYDPKLITTFSKGWYSTSTSPAYDATKRKAEEDAMRAKVAALASASASRGDAQQAALEQWKKQNRDNIAAKKTAEAKAQAAKDAAWNAKVQAAKQPTNIGASQAGNTARAMKEYMTKASADRKAQVQAAKQPTNIGASQSADLARWKQQNQNNIAEKKAIQKKKDLIAKADASYAKNIASEKGSKNNWQNQANAQRAMKEYMTKASAERKAQEATEKAKQSASYNKMSSTQKNAMQNDPRYTSNKPGPLFTSRDPKYGYSGKNDSRAPVFKEATYIDLHGNKTGGKETKMDRDPYFESWSKATNKQETAKAQAGNKAFMNAFEESKKRNSRSDLGNAIADAKEDAKNAFKALKKKLKKKK